MTRKRIALYAALMTLGWGVTSTTQAQNTNELSVHHAIEVEYQTESGKVYALQGSITLNQWTDIGDPIVGNGQLVHRLVSLKDSSAAFAAYRLHIIDGPTNGYAPWSLQGVHLRMEDSAATNEVHFLTSTNGEDAYVSGKDGFSYHYERTGENDGLAERVYSPTRRDVLRYNYRGAGVGSWVREEYEQSLLKNRVVGAFHYVSQPQGTNPPVSVGQPPTPPTSLTGAVYYAFTGPQPEKYVFNAAGNTGIAVPASTGGEHETSVGGNAFTYTYKVLTSDTASLVINFGYYGIGGDRQEYEMQFNDGATALFTRRIYRLGSLFTTDHGVYSPNSVLITTSDPGEPATPPTTPVGLTYTMKIDATPIRLVFSGGSEGIQYDDSAPNEFSYTYGSTGVGSYHLVVKLKADRWDEYDLKFTAGRLGTAVVKQFRKNVLNRTVGGTFTVAPSTP